jgi:hypothetical protein
MVAIRPNAELIESAVPAWPALQELIRRSSVPVTVLPVEREDGERTLYRLQVASSTTLGALALETGGMLVDSGWLRLLGGGYLGDDGLLVDLAGANELGDPEEDAPAPSVFTVAHDVLGGRFAVNNGALPGEPGKVCYWGPDTLEWTLLGITHTAFVEWALSGSLAQFYQDLRWPDWADEVKGLPPDQGLACYPFLFSDEGRDIAETLRVPVPFDELTTLLEDLARQVGYLPSAPAIRPPRHSLRLH